MRYERITRAQGIELIKKYEGKIPRKYLDKFLKSADISEQEFHDICDKFTNKELFKKDENGILLRDKLGNLEKINYDNLQ